MREIKFRAWDNKRKCICKVQQILFDNHNKPKAMLIPYNQFNAYWERNVILMQYTGLKDRNGREIYEGDIVKVNYSNEESVGQVIWVGNYAEFAIKISKKEYRGLYNEANIEVIGNIYENLELLKEVDEK